MIKSQKQNLNHLIDAFRDGNETEFIFLLDTYAFNSNVSLHSIGIESSLIEYILSTPKSSNFIKICLKYGDNYHKRNSNGFSFLDFAVKSLCADNLKILVDHLNRLGLEYIVQQMTLNNEIPNNNNLLHNVLHSLSTENKEECKKIIEILLKNGCNPNHFNAEHITPFELLLNKIQNDKLGSDLIEIFLANSFQCIEISDSEFNRNLVTDINSDKLIIRIRSIADIAHLIDLINQGNENEFIEILHKTEISIQVSNNFTELMKRCIGMNFVNGAKELMQYGFNVSESNMNNGCDRHSFISKVTASKIDEKPLLFYAVKLNRPKIIKLLLDLNCAQFKSEKNSYSVLHKICSMQEADCDEDFQKCFNLLIKNHQCDISLINGFDGNRKTPLMYACENDHKQIIYELLRRGAYIGHECIIEKLSGDVLRKVLDDSIVPTRDINDQNCAVQINYKFLIPPKYSEKRNDETKALKLIASQSKFKNLMTHPVLTSYLELKWKRVNILVYVTLFLYFIFFVYLSVFILNFFSDSRYAGNMSKVNNESSFGTRDHIPRETTTTTINPLIEELKNVNVWKAIFSRKKREVIEVISENTPQTNAELAIDPKSINSYIASNKINYAICLIGTLILTFCEIVQFIFSWKRYFLKLSNWVDCVLLYLAYVVLLNYYADDVELFRKFRAVLFLVISVQSFILLSRVSKLSLQLEIFKKVSRTFLKFIMLYFMLLFAFAMAFYTLYGRDKKEEKSSDENKKENIKKPENDDENGFQNILISVVTVIRMMLSDFDKMKLDPQDMFNSIIFLTFVILITIILFNLLNALAINDTQQIMKSAEIVDVRKRIAMVGNCEQILAFLKVEDFNVFTKLIHNGRIFLKVNEDNYVRVEKVNEQIFESKENGYQHINMGQLNDIYEKPYEKYVKVETKWSKNFHELHKKFGNLRLLDPHLTLGKENISKIIKHVKDLMEEEK